MHRTAWLPIACMLLSGCAVLQNQPPETRELAASLSYVAGDKPLESGSGIVSVGNYYFPNGYPRTVYFAPGKRDIGYYCPGPIYVDGPPTISYNFLGGQQYEFYCKNNEPHIRVKQAATSSNHSSKQTQ